MSESDLPGAALRTAREERGLGVREVASALKVPAIVVTNIEDEKFDELPARVFARAYLRRYAELVGLEPQRVLWAYDQKTDPDRTEEAETQRLRGVSGSMATFVREMKARHWQSWVFGGTVVLFSALAGLFLWFAWPSDAPMAPAPAGEPTEVAVGDTAQPASSADDAVPDEASEPVSDETIGPRADESPAQGEPAVADSASAPVLDRSPTGAPESSLDAQTAVPPDRSPDTQPAVPPDASPDRSPAAAPNGSPNGRSDSPSNAPEEEPVALSNPLTYVPGDEHMLAFQFAQDSWVEVIDASGARLHQDLERAEDRLEVRGVAPFTITLGYAPGVQLEYNGEPVILAQHTNDNNVAKLVLGL